MAHLLFILVCIIWGSSFALMRLSLGSFGYMHVSFYRALGGAIVLALIWVTGRRRLRLGDNVVLPLIALATIGYAAPYTIQPYVIREIEAAVGRGSSFMGLVIALVPLFTVAVQAMMMRIWPSPREWVGVLGGLALLTFLAWEEVSQGVPVSVFLLAALTPLCYAVGNTYVKHRFHDASPLALTTTAMAIATLLLLPLAATDQPVRVNEQFPVALAGLTVLGIVCTGFGSYFFYKIIQAQGPLFAGMVGYIIPGIALVLGALMKESITFVQIITLLGVFAMVAIVQYRPRVATVQELAEAEAREGS